MADLNDRTQNVNIWDDAKTKAVTVTTDGSKERLDIHALIDPLGNAGTPVHAYNLDTDSDVGDTIVTYTVTTGKSLYIYQWGISDNSYGTYQLRINGTSKDAVVNETSSAGQRGLNQTTYPIPMIATSGQVVSIYKLSGLSNKTTAGTIVGVER